MGSMYGIFTYMYHKNQPNVGKYTIHGWYGAWLHDDKSYSPWKNGGRNSSKILPRLSIFEFCRAKRFRQKENDGNKRKRQHHFHGFQAVDFKFSRLGGSQILWRKRSGKIQPICLEYFFWWWIWMILYVKNTAGKNKLDLSGGLTPGFRRRSKRRRNCHVQLVE